MISKQKHQQTSKKLCQKHIHHQILTASWNAVIFIAPSTRISGNFIQCIDFLMRRLATAVTKASTVLTSEPEIATARRIH